MDPRLQQQIDELQNELSRACEAIDRLTELNARLNSDQERANQNLQRSMTARSQLNDVTHEKDRLNQQNELQGVQIDKLQTDLQSATDAREQEAAKAELYKEELQAAEHRSNAEIRQLQEQQNQQALRVLQLELENQQLEARTQQL